MIFDGLTPEKVLLIALLVGALAGPDRMAAWVRTAADLTRRARSAYRDGRRAAARELDTAVPEWREYDPRRLDPRRVDIDRLLGGDDRKTAEPPHDSPTEGPEQ